MPFPPERTPTKTTLIPALSALILCAELVLYMSESAASAEHTTGDDISSSSSADVRVLRDALLSLEKAEMCAISLRAVGPHASMVPPVVCVSRM